MKTLKRRRKERKTDYSKRIKILKSDSPRIIFRKTNKYILAQYGTSIEAKDKIEIGMASKILLEYGWPKEFRGSLKSTSASYLLGFLMGKKIFSEKTKKIVPDSGMIKKTHKNKFFAFLKGLKDSGIKIKCEEKLFPPEERIKGKNLKKDFSKIFGEIKKNIQENKKWKK